MARRAGRPPGPVASSSSTASKKKQRPQQAKGPKSIHDVYDFAVKNDDPSGNKKKSRADRSIARAKLGSGTNDMDDIQGSHTSQRRHRSKNSNNNQDGDDNDDDEEDDDSEIESDDEGTARRKAGPSFLDASDDDAQDAVASEDDSDIDSDDAFGDSQDEMGLGRNRVKNNNNRRHQDSESDMSDADDFEDDQGSDIVDLSRMLDDDNESRGMDMMSDGDDDQGSSSGEDQSDDEDTQSRLARLAQSYAQASSKRPQDSDDDDEQQQASSQATKRQRRLLSAKTEAMPESEYAATSSSSRGRRNIAIDDLLGSLGDGSNTGDMSALRANTKALRQTQRSSASDSKQPVASRSGGGALSAPLPDVIKDKIQRSAGYELSKEEADKWQSTIKRLREAEHLSFPLQAGPSRPKASTAQMTASFKPSNALEQDIDGILQSQGLSEAQIAKHEELAMRKLDPEEAQRRREELRAMRELTFRAEQKAKRANKIKSKTYRKIARKDKEKQRQKMIAAGILPGDDDDDDDEDMDGGMSADRAKAERQRAKERATLKHKNTGKWAQSALGKREQDEDTRNAINEQLARSDQLRRRIQGKGDDGSDSDDSDGTDNNDGDALTSAFDEIRTLDAEDEADAAREGEADNTGKKGVWNMKFMKDARSREDAVNRQSRRELEKELREMGKDDSGSGSDSDSDSDSDDGDTQQLNVGRRIFGNTSAEGGQRRVQSSKDNGKAANTAADEDSDQGEQDEEEDAGQSASLATMRPSKRTGLSAPAEPEDSGSNPWLASTATSKRTSANALRSTSAAGKSNAKLDKHKSKAAGARADAEDDARVEIDPNAMLVRRENQSGLKMQPDHTPKAASSTNRPNSQRDDEQDDDSDSSSSSNDKPVPTSKKGSQRDLIAEAFAGDDVTSDFTAAKARAIAEDAPQEVDDSLPGWGSWCGKGAKRKTKPNKPSRVKMTAGLDPSKRADAKMSNVIINEKRDKKLDKYRAKELPYPYTSAAQYQASLAQPIGPEWNTTTQNQRLQMPRVLQTKPGSVIKPVQRVK